MGRSFDRGAATAPPVGSGRRGAAATDALTLCQSANRGGVCARHNTRTDGIRRETAGRLGIRTDVPARPLDVAERRCSMQTLARCATGTTAGASWCFSLLPSITGTCVRRLNRTPRAARLAAVAMTLVDDCGSLAYPRRGGNSAIPCWQWRSCQPGYEPVRSSGLLQRRFFGAELGQPDLNLRCEVIVDPGLAQRELQLANGGLDVAGAV